MITVNTFANKSIGVLGLGNSGLSAVRALVAGGSDVWAWDDVKEKRNTAEVAGVKLTDLYHSDLSKIDALVLSPGIPDQYPEPHILTVRAKDTPATVTVFSPKVKFCEFPLNQLPLATVLTTL